MSARSAAPPVRRLVLYKHGIAYVERRGPASEPFELAFTQGEMADILKSFTAWVQTGSATVGWVGFDKPEDPNVALERKNLNLDPHGVLVGLLGTLTGRKISLETAKETLEGIFAGLDSANKEHGAVAQRVLLQTASDLKLIPLEEVRGLKLLETTSQDKLEYYLDRKRAAYAGENKTILVDVKGTAEDLGVSYIVPAPTWRVSYRVVLTGEEAIFMGWGIVHNPLENELENVELTLTTGQPNSFVIDLYNPQEVNRTVVTEAKRVAMAPMISRARAAPAMSMARASIGHAAFADDNEGTPNEGVSAAKMDVGAAPQAEMASRGEFFEYRVKTPVSMRNGGSAMVPLFSSRAPAKKERVWNVRAQAGAPDIVLRLKNDTGATLEEGPAVLYDDATYAGEAMLPFRARGALVQLAFAKDLSLKCSCERLTGQKFVRVRLGKGALVEELSSFESYELTLTNEGEAEASVLFHLERTARRELTPESVQPEHATPEGYEFRLSAAPGQHAVAKVQERWLTTRAIHWGGVTHAHLANWLANKFLDGETIGALEGVVTMEHSAGKLRSEIEELKANWEQWSARQNHVRGQLEVLREGGEEGAMRLRVAKEMEESMRAMDATAAQIQKLTAQEKEVRRAAETELRRVLGG